MNIPRCSWDNDWTINWATFSSWWWIIGSCYDYDWSNDYINIPDDASLNFWTWDFSVNYWINPDANPWYPINKKNNSTSTSAGWWSRSDWETRIADWNSQSIESPLAWTTWAFYMLTINFDRSWNMEIFKNNSSVWTDDITAESDSVSNAIPMFIWARYNSAVWSPFAEGFFNWKIDEVWLWTKLLDATDRANLYNSWAALAYWSFTS